MTQSSEQLSVILSSSTKSIRSTTNGIFQISCRLLTSERLYIRAEGRRPIVDRKSVIRSFLLYVYVRNFTACSSGVRMFGLDKIGWKRVHAIWTLGELTRAHCRGSLCTEVRLHDAGECKRGTSRGPSKTDLLDCNFVLGNAPTYARGSIPFEMLQ